MKVLELFAGAGGAALGLRAAGLRSVGLCEWDADACETLRAAGFGPVIEGDVRDLEAIEAAITAPPDVLWSSFPCQAWSTAGSRKGAQDERNGWPWTVAAIDRFGPRWVLCENVRGLLCHSASQCGDPVTCPGCYLERVILPDLRARFEHVGWWLLDAADFGVPQHRRRVILWGGPRPLSRPEATHADPAELAQVGLFAARQPWRSMGEALGFHLRDDEERHGNRARCSSEPSRTVGGGGNTMVRIIGGGQNPRYPGDRRDFRDLTDEPSTTIAAMTGGGAGNAGPFVIGNYRGRDGGAVMETHSADEPSRAIRHGGGSSVPYVIGSYVGPSPTVTATEHKGCANDPRRASRAMRRRLTVEECATLQDFPPDHPFQGTQTSRYRQVGNAVPPKLAEVVARAVLDAEQR